MARADILQLAAELAARREPFVLAMVVRRERSTSAQPGDAAVVTLDGEFHGWLGGSCTRPTVVREAKEALSDGKPRLLSLTPDPEGGARPGVVVHPMTCHSGGTVDVFLEPVIPSPRLVVFGLAPVAKALCRLGSAMGYAVEAVDPEATKASFPEAERVWAEFPAPEIGKRRPWPELFAVVATMGERDEEALASVLPHAPAYLGVVASRKRFADIRETLAGRGLASALAEVRNPAGLEIGATTPEEIALAVLAEIVKVRREVAHQSAAAASARPAEESAIDPVCGMTVAVPGAKHRAAYLGQTYFFCRDGCRERFVAEPKRYLESARAKVTP